MSDSIVPPPHSGDDGSSTAASDAREKRGLQSELAESINTVLNALQAVGRGDLTTRLESKYPESHPVGALCASITSMIEDLKAAREESASYMLELSERITIIERQREAIRTLSVPIIEVWSGVLCAPVVGTLDSARAAEVTTTLLSAVVEKRAHYAIIDVTGIEAMDTHSADNFLRMARAVNLLGTRCMLSGVRPNIARTIVHMGVELHGLKSYRTMREALQRCVVEIAQRARKQQENS